MKIDKVIRREVRFVSVGTVFFSALLQLVYLALGAWSGAVLFGTLLSATAGVLNFLLLGVTVQGALATGDADSAKARLKLSQMLRMFGMLAVLAVGVLLPIFNTVAVIVSVFFSAHDSGRAAGGACKEKQSGGVSLCRTGKGGGAERKPKRCVRACPYAIRSSSAYILR